MDPFQTPSELQRPKFFQSSSGELVEVTDALVDACYTVKCLINARGRMAFKNSLGGVFIFENNQVIHQKEQKVMATLLQNDAERLIVYIHEVRTPILRRLLDFISFHQTDITERERKSWNATYIEQCSQILCELASAAYYLDHKPLVNLTSRAIASQISGKTTEELREVLGTQNEPPLPASMTSHLPARFRLQAKVDSRKQREKLAILNGTAPPAIEAPPPPPVEPDNRSIEEILAFLGEDTSPSPSGKGKKGKKGAKASSSSSPAKKSASQSSNKSKGNKNHNEPKNEPKKDAKVESTKKETEQKQKTLTTPSETSTEALVEKETTKLAVNTETLPIQGESTSVEPVSATPKKASKSLNVSASSSTSTNSTATSPTAEEEAALTAEIAAALTPSILNSAMLTHLTFPSPFAHNMSHIPSSSNSTSLEIHSASHGISNHSQAPPGIAIPSGPIGSPVVGGPMHSMGSHSHAAPVSRPNNTQNYLPITNFLPTVAPTPLAGPPGIDLPPGLQLSGFRSPSTSPAPGTPSLPHSSPSIASNAPVTWPPGLASDAFSTTSSSAALLGFDPSSSFAIETSSCPLPVLTSSSSSAQYYWGTGDDDDILKGQQDESDFELELAEFRQSLELGMRSSGNSLPPSLRSSSDGRSSSNGHKPVGAY